MGGEWKRMEERTGEEKREGKVGKGRASSGGILLQGLGGIDAPALLSIVVIKMCLVTDDLLFKN